MNRMTIRKALLTIKGHCGKHISCTGCSLKKWCDYMCMNDGSVPFEWDVEELLKKSKGDNNED